MMEGLGGCETMAGLACRAPSPSPTYPDRPTEIPLTTDIFPSELSVITDTLSSDGSSARPVG